METKLNEQDSLKLINEMITQTRNNFQKGAGNSFIFYGICVAVIAIINFILLYVLNKPYNSFFIWFLMIPASIVGTYSNLKKGRKAIVKTHIDNIIGSTWSAFGYSIIVLLLSIFSTVFIIKDWSLTLLINPAILTMLGLANFVTGVACRYKPYIRSTYIFWLGALLCVASYLIGMSNLQFIILAICMILGFIIPGYVINRKAKENV